MGRFDFHPPNSVLDEDVGFRTGAKGTHTSRTMMSTELRAVLEAGGEASPDQLILEDNLLGKATHSGRQLSWQRLRELHGLEQAVPIFRALDAAWRRDSAALPLLALLSALARDPLLRATARPVLSLAPGSELIRDSVRHALASAVGGRLSPDTLDKVLRNAASTWAQSGHLEGRTFKRRRKVAATPAALAFALWLGQAAGFVGEDLLLNGWIAALDLEPSELQLVLERARAAGLLDVRQLGARPEIDATRLSTLRVSA